MSSTTGILPQSAPVTAQPVRGLSFAGTLRAELQKVLGMRATLVLFLVGVVGFAGIMLLLTLGTPVGSQMIKAPALALATFEDSLFLVFTVGSGIFLLLTGARLVGMEYSLGTLRVVLARGTARVSLLVAKLLALYLIGIALLIAFLAGSVAWIGLATWRWTGSLSALTTGGSNLARDLGILVLLMLLSLFCTTVVGTAMATIGRSVAFGVGAAMGLFPADNFATLILLLIGELTKQKLWAHVTAYLFGPSLNVLPTLAITDRHVRSALPPPNVTVTLAHALTVVGVWALGLLVLELVLTWRRDVLA